MTELSTSMKMIKSIIVLSILALSAFLPVAAGQGFEANYLIPYPSYTDSTAIESWRSWICITNPWDQTAYATIYIYNQDGNYLGEQKRVLSPGASYFVRPRNIVGYDCSGSAAVISDTPLFGILEKTRNNNQMTNAYSASLWELRPATQSSSKSWSAVSQQ